MLEALSNEWVSFQQCLIDNDSMLKKSKEKFKSGLLYSAEDLKKSVNQLHDDLAAKGAFSAKIPVDEVNRLVFHPGTRMLRHAPNYSSLLALC